MTHYPSTGRILKALNRTMIEQTMLKQGRLRLGQILKASKEIILIRTMIEQTTLKQVSNPFDTKIGFK